MHNITIRTKTCACIKEKPTLESGTWVHSQIEGEEEVGVVDSRVVPINLET